MKRIIIVLLLPLMLASCDYIGSTRVKNLIDLTPKLEAETTEKITLPKSNKTLYAKEKIGSYKLSKGEIISRPAIAKGVVYSVDNKGYVSAFSLKEKKILWTCDIAKSNLTRQFSAGGILYSDGKLFVTNGSRNLFVLEAGTGIEILRKEFPDILRAKPILATDKLLFVQTISNQLLAYNIESSKLVWMHEGGLETISAINNVVPVVYNGNVIVSYSSGEIFSLDIETGQEQWAFNLSNAEDLAMPNLDPLMIVTAPIVSENYLIFATTNRKLIKLDLDNGAPVWIKQAEDIQSMSLIGDDLFVTNNARQVAAISAHNGKIKWAGDLISRKERQTKRPKTVLFQPPFITKVEGGNAALNVLGNNGELYQFIPGKSGILPVEPIIKAIEPHVFYCWFSCCTGEMHLFTKSHIKF
jgi:outer membrane protein assembly factor BamB